MRVAIYARVSTVEQSAENQLAELRRYIDASWLACKGILRYRHQRIEG